MPPPESTGLALAPRHLAELRALLQRHVPDAEVWAFGSRVSGGAHEGSDLDLVLRSAQDPAQPVAGRATLQEALQNSTLPMMVEVHDWALVPAAFHDAIQRAHVTLQVARPLALAEANQDKLGDARFSEPALAKEWLSQQDEAGWAHLQGKQ
jgi:predicted nucleotidyltransferase